MSSVRFALSPDEQPNRHGARHKTEALKPPSSQAQQRSSFHSPVDKANLPTIQEHKIDSKDDQDEVEQFVIHEVEETHQNRIMVGAGQGGVDLDDIFGFDRNKTKHRLTLANRFSRVIKRPELFDFDEEGDLYQSLPKWFAYFILGVFTFINSIMVTWISLIPSDKMLRVSWRLLLQALMLIPFVLYEQRNLPERFQTCFTIEYIFKVSNFKPLFIAAWNISTQLAVQLYCFGWTHMSTVVLFLQMTNFWLSVMRAYRGEQTHFVEKCGRFMCLFGVMTVWFDSGTFDPTRGLSHQDVMINNGVYFRWPWQRNMIGNLMCNCCAFMIAFNSRFTADIKNLYPPFFSLCVINTMASFHLLGYSYFVDGISINNDPFWGYFGISQDGSFTQFMYMSLLLSLGLFISSVFITKLYEPVIPAAVANIEPILNTYFLELLYVQVMPGPLAGMGYFMICPGQFLIVIGQHFFIKEKEYTEKLAAAERMKAVERNTIKNIRASRIDNTNKEGADKKPN